MTQFRIRAAGAVALGAVLPSEARQGATRADIPSLVTEEMVAEAIRALSPLPPGSRVVVIPAEGSPEWEALADRVWRAQMTAPKSRRVDGWRDTIDAVLRALTEGEKP